MSKLTENPLEVKFKLDETTPTHYIAPHKRREIYNYMGQSHLSLGKVALSPFMKEAVSRNTNLRKHIYTENKREYSQNIVKAR